MSFGIFLFEKVGYCCEEVDCVCGTTQFAGANYVATVILSQFCVGIVSGKGPYTLSTVDFGEIYYDNGCGGNCFIGTIVAVVGGFVNKRLLYGGHALCEKCFGGFFVVANI